jgi:nucleoside-diphosphate-sugar epimerase
MSIPVPSRGRLLITGVPGWLTAALLDDLSRSPCEGVGGIRALLHPSRQESIPQLRKSHPNLEEFVCSDLGFPGDLEPALAGIDAVLHSAAIIHVRRTSDWYRVNTAGTEKLATAAKRAGARRFVFVSSNAAGGRSESAARLLSENDPDRPLSHYGRSKWLAEQSLLRLHEPGRFEVVILRPSMFYGPPVPARHVDIYRRILTGRMPIVGNGDYARSITYIGHLVQATRLALTHPAASGQKYYIVDRPVYTTRRICEAMARALGVPLRTLRVPAMAGAAAYWLDSRLGDLGLYWQNLHLVGESHWNVGLSCEKATAELGYRPTMELEEGMVRAVEWCRRKGFLPD